MSFKPGDFYVNATQLFGIIVPGAALLCLFPDLLDEAARVSALRGGASRAFAFGAASFVAGHMLRAIAGILNPVYSVLYRRWRGNVTELEAALGKLGGLRESEHGPTPLQVGITRSRTLDWVLTQLRVSPNVDLSGITVYDAEADLFQSLVLIGLLAVFVFLARGAVGAAFVGLCTAGFSVLRFMRLRLKHEEGALRLLLALLRRSSAGNHP